MAVGPAPTARTGAVYSDITANTFTNFLRVLLNKSNFNLKKEVDGQLLVQPSWSHRLSHENELWKEASKRCRTMSMGIDVRSQRSQDPLGPAGSNGKFGERE